MKNIPFLLIIIYSTIINAQTNRKGLWIWDNSDIITNTSDLNILVNQCVADKITDVFLFANVKIEGSVKTKIQHFISTMKCNDINTWALDGYRGYFADWKGRSGYINFINSIIEYNNTSNADERFIGVLGNNEPQDNQGELVSSFHNNISDSNLNKEGGGVWKETEALDREYLMRDWIEMTEEAFDLSHRNNLIYAQTVNDWLDDYFGEPVKCIYNGVYDNVMTHIMPFIDDYFVTTYNTDPDNAFNRIKAELVYAETLPKNNRPRIWGVTETYCGVGKTISYCDTDGKNNKEAVKQDIIYIETKASAYAAFVGYTIHDWKGWKSLAPVSINDADPGCVPLSNNKLDKNTVNIYYDRLKREIIINNSDEIFDVNIYNLLGQKIKTTKLEANKYVINQHQSKGVYIIYLNNQTLQLTKKITIH